MATLGQIIFVIGKSIHKVDFRLKERTEHHFDESARMGKTGLIKNAFYQIHQENPEAACFYMDIFSTTCLNDFIILFGQQLSEN